MYIYVFISVIIITFFNIITICFSRAVRGLFACARTVCMRADCLQAGGAMLLTLDPSRRRKSVLHVRVAGFPSHRWSRSSKHFLPHSCPFLKLPSVPVKHTCQAPAQYSRSSVQMLWSQPWTSYILLPIGKTARRRRLSHHHYCGSPISSNA